MTTLNPQYISSTPLQWVFLNRDGTGALGDGIVTFYKQDNKMMLKSIYQLDNSVPTGFSELNNPIQLTAIGTFADDNGNDIIPYFYPFDSAGNPELYYVTVYSSTGVLQFTRDDWPPNEGGESGNNANEITNYVANGQFLLHNNPAVITATQATVITNESDLVQYIASGGWTFEKESTSNSVDTVTFVRELNSSDNPTVDANPRYYCQIVTNGPDSNYSRKDLCLKFPDVNKFAANLCTFSWYGMATSGGSPIVTIILRQYFGTGSATGSNPGNIIETVIGTVEINPSVSQFYNVTFLFPQEVIPPTTVSPNVDNDYLQLCIRLPNSAQTVQFTDFILQPGIFPATAFPQTPNDIFIEQSTIGYLPTPAYDGSDLYLPLILTPQGTAPDYSVVGQIIGKTQLLPINNELLMDGKTYVASAYSAIGVPYQRLMNYLLLNSPSVSITISSPSSLTALLNGNDYPMYGTGANFVTVFYKSGSGTSFFVQLNTAIAGTVSDGAGLLATGWTFTATVANTTYTLSNVTVPTAGQYWTFTDGLLGKVYNVWYSINGVGTAPAVPTGANIQVNLVGTPTIAYTIGRTVGAVNLYQFAILDTRGYFWRGAAASNTVDPDYNTRTISGVTFNTTPFTGANPGSLEAQAFLAHSHTYSLSLSGSHNTSGGSDPVMNGNTTDVTTAGLITGTIGPNGGDETRPINLSLNWFIKY